MDARALHSLPAEERRALEAVVAAAVVGCNEAREPAAADVVQLFRTSVPAAFGDARTVVAVTGMERTIYPGLYASGAAAATALERELAVISQAHAVAVPSEVARRDVIARAGRSPADVTSVGAPLEWTRSWRRGPRRAVVVPGAVAPHRNVEGVIAAYASLPADVRATHRLVLGTGRRALRRHLVQVARAAGVRAVTAGPVPACLEHAAVAVFPAFWDGHEPGAAEARALGVPIAASTASAAAALALEPELLFDPRDAATLARVLARALAPGRPRPAPQTVSDPGRALRAVWERLAAGREVLQSPNLLPSDSDAPA